MATLPAVIFNDVGANSQTFLQATVANQKRQQIQETIDQKVSTLIGTSDQISNTIQRELENEAEMRYNPYRPRIPEFIPPSVIELEMRTRNVGVPIPTMTIGNCKGVQFVTR
jgi:hypothetical protein